MKVITICHHKGGVAKSTTAAALGHGISVMQKKSRVLLIDADPQGTLTKSVYGIKQTVPGLYSVIMGEKDWKSVIMHTESGDIVPYEKKTGSLDAELISDPGKDYKLRESLEELEGYSHVIIDTSPYLNLANIQALTASDIVIIPVCADPECVDSLPETLKTIRTVQKYSNKTLTIGGAVMTLYDGRANVVKQYADLIEDVCKKNEVRLLKTKVRTCAAIKEAHAMKENLFTYAPKSNAVADYTAIIKELKL